MAHPSSCAQRPLPACVTPQSRSGPNSGSSASGESSLSLESATAWQLHAGSGSKAMVW
jgi:hypothetical protein